MTEFNELFYVEDEKGILTVFKDQIGAENFIKEECPKGILLNHSGYPVAVEKELNGGD